MEYYQEILAFHIISVLSWMAMLFYMPRLFVYHVENIEKKEFVEVVKIQEDKIYRVIGFPAMIATILSGSVLIYFNPSLLEQDWMIAKLLTLILMIIYSFSLESYRKILHKDECTKNGQFFRAYNEIPTLFAILIVVFVITKSVPVYFSIGISLFFGFVIYKILNKKVSDA
jgi:putative membrane protein